MITYKETHWSERVIKRHQEEQSQIQIKGAQSAQDQFLAAALLIIFFALIISIFLFAFLNPLIPSIP